MTGSARVRNGLLIFDSSWRDPSLFRVGPGKQGLAFPWFRRHSSPSPLTDEPPLPSFILQRKVLVLHFVLDDPE